jgi:hypothetical protein
MLSVIYGASITALGIMLAMASWYVIGFILVVCFDVNNRNVRVLKTPDASFFTALFVILVSIPACHLYVSAMDHVAYGK